MDGVLIDSEPLWKIAMEEAFHSVGCMITKKDFQKTVGLRIDEVITYWHQEVGWERLSVKDVENLIVQKMIALIEEKTGEKLNKSSGIGIKPVSSENTKRLVKRAISYG